jgi:hypothetical protein
VGNLSDLEDRRAQLVQAEAALLTEFHNWLRNPKLDEIRQQVAHLARECSLQGATKPESEPSLTLFLTGYPIELERLPWEAWEIGRELGTVATIRIARAPDQIRANPTNHLRYRRNRVLVILGDDTGLDFKADREAVQGLASVADIHFLGWQPGQDSITLLTQITQAITDPQGWDILLFAGHSNETATSGGELAIAPNLALTINELAPYLEIARQHGLQFALFNSCNGLTIAKTLIDLGFNQVAVMREPIHNRVAQEFLIQFLRRLGQYQDVHEALIAASQTLRLEKNLTFPSSALIPSLFCRPGQPLFRFRKFGWREWLRQLRPTRIQAAALAGIVGLSLLLPVQSALLDQRLWSQALYRRVTGQTTGVASPRPITLVQIDEESLVKGGISEPNPMDRTYLAELIDQLSDRQARIIGLDYVLDRPAQDKADDQTIADTLQRAAARETWLVLASIPSTPADWSPILPGVSFPSPLPNWSLAGDIESHSPYFSLVNPWADPEHTPPPLTYQLALAAALEADSTATVPRPNLQSQSPLITQAIAYLETNQTSHIERIAPRSRYHSITVLAYWVSQMWLQPIIDFSLPPEQVYQTLPAWQLLDGATAADLTFANHIVILAPGSYGEAGIAPHQDTLKSPAAVRHWRFWQGDAAVPIKTITGGEVHAYMLHHLLTQRLVIPIPDLWMIGLAALFSQGVGMAWRNPSITRRQGYFLLLGTTAVYGLVSLQLYLSTQILLPWLLPTITGWIYGLPVVNNLSAKNQPSFFVAA